MLASLPGPARVRPRRLLAWLAPSAILLAICVVLLWKIALSREYTWINAPDYVNQVVPWFDFQAREWHAHRFPLWDPYHWAGQPLVGQAQPGSVYPLNWILFLLPLKNGHVSLSALHWYLIAIHFMAAVFGYLLCRELGCSKRASILGGTAFTFSGFLGTTEWPQMINGVVWTPMVLLFFFRAMRGRRPLLNASLSGACLGIAFLSGHHQAPLFFSLFMAGLWIYAFVAMRERWRRLPALAAVFAIFAGLFSAAQILPAVECGKISVRWVSARSPVGWADKVPYAVHEHYSMNPAGVLGMAIPGIYIHFNPFLGPTILLLAVGGAILRWNDRYVRILTAIAFAGLIFSLGANTVFHGFLYSVIPGLEKARTPSAAVFLFQLPAAALAALGCDSLLRDARREADAVWRKLSWAAWVFGGVILVGLFAVSLVQNDAALSHSRKAVVALTSIAFGVVMFARRRGAISHGGAAALAILLVMIDLGTCVGYAWSSREQGWRYVDKVEANADIVRFLRAQPGDFRVDVDRDVLEYNMGDADGIEQFNGYAAGVTANIIRINGSHQAHLLLGEKYHVGAKPNAPDQQEVFRSASGLHVYLNPDAQPRVWTVHRAIGVSNEGELFAQLGRPIGELRLDAVVSGSAPALESCAGPDEVRSIQHRQSKVVIDVRMACKGMLILTDTFTPGWIATVRGQPVQIYETYGAVRSIVVPAGESRVEFVYRPVSVFAGAALTALGIVLLAIVFVVERQRKREDVPLLAGPGLTR